MRRKDILARHPYKVYQSTDGYWHTYVVDPNAKTKRKQIKKKSQRLIEDELVKIYTQTKGTTLSTLEEIYPHWLQYQYSTAAASTSVRRRACDWNRWLKNDPIVKRPIQEIDGIEITEWASNFIKGQNPEGKPMTEKQYYNMVGVIKGLFQYAVDKAIIDDNIYSLVKIKKRFFAKTVREVDDKTQVFRDDDLNKARNLALEDYINKGDEAALAVLLISYTGIRAGEACGLYWKAFNDDMSEMYIESQLVRKEVLKKDGTWERTTFEIIDMPKTEAGFRSVYIPKKIRGLLQQHKKAVTHNKPTDCVFLNRNNGLIDDSYLYRRTRRYSQKASQISRGTHKLRKTYLSRLYDGGVHERSLLRLAGHALNGANAGTTLRNHYLRDRNTPEEVRDNIEKLIY